MKGFWAWLRELLCPAPITEEDIYQFAFERWRVRFWWRFPPSEGWHVGYTCTSIPWEAHLHFQKYGRIVPPSRQEVIRDINQFGHNRLGRCPADNNIAASLATH